MGDILSGLFGVVAGGLPAVFQMFGKWQDHKMERQRHEDHLEALKITGAQHLEEANVQADSADYTAAMAHDTAGIDRASVWVVNIKQLVRPYLAAVITTMMLYTVIFCLNNPDTLGSMTMPELIAMVRALCWAVILFYFTNRGISKALDREK